ncbi:hypothetical protein HBA55_05150 [Pseudomaricurvus alkylphenolicus]|uniref:acyl-CoA dehydrogenase family protein n=1 Tax=Pseudomaricurvus alkylphenolicus TaxID=1306991 RepID=UPI0014201CE0|nr:acyl-CoA dehydrogenase family protein [Pseudomaricurvus alkylphenolicus]NIB38962.1 hypothetical protein [Pseudomaricurvus alkylphenolicus]
MDFRLGEAAERVRTEIRQFLEQEFSQTHRQQERDTGDGHNWSLYRKLADQGWVSAAWPKEFGGGGRDPYEMLALYWELSKAGFPWFGLLNNSFIGHTLMAMGSEQQKAELVPKIASGDIMVALGYTEPSSGSDVAAARTSARREQDHWVIEGQKMFTTTGHMAQYIFTLVRTDAKASKHRGLTMFLIPTDAPGVEIYPVHTMGGERTNSVFFGGVKIEDAQRVGEVNEGWAVVRFALGLEQAMGYADRQEALLEKAEQWALASTDNNSITTPDPRMEQQLGRMAANAEVARLLRYRSTWMQAEGMAQQTEGTMTKAFSAKVFLQDAQDWMDLMGPLALLEHGTENALSEGAFAEAYRATPVATIYGGTLEILYSLIGQMALKFPRNR